MKVKSLLLLGAALFAAAALSAQQAKVIPAKADPPAKTKTVAKQRAQIEPMDGDRTYKANCARCHQAPRKFSERKMATIMRHMRVRANMTAEETEAVLRYLTK